MLVAPSAAVSAVTVASATSRALALPELLYAVLNNLAGQADQDPLHTQSALRACTLVNRTWYLHANAFLYRAPFLGGHGGSGGNCKHHTKATKALIRTLTTTSHGLHVRSLARVPSETWELFTSLKECFLPCPRLSTLALTFRAGEQGHWMEPFLKENFDHLDPVVREGMSRVTELDLTSVGVKDADRDDAAYTEASLNCLAACTRLQKLTTTQADWSMLTELPKTLSNLSISFLHPPSLQSSVHLAPFLAGLTHLHVHYTPKAEPPQAFMAVVARTCKQLVSVDVCSETITVLSLRTLVANNREHLLEIHLRNCSDEYTMAVLENRPAKLEVLDMGTVDAKLVLKALEVCPSLVSIGKTIARHASGFKNNVEYWTEFLSKAKQLQELHVERWSDFHSKDLLFNTVLPQLGPKLKNVWFGWRDLLSCDDLEKVLVSCKRLEVLRAPVKGNSQNLIRTFKKHGPSSRLREVRLICDNFKLVDDDKRRMYRVMPHLAHFTA